MSTLKTLQTGHVGLNVTDLDRSVAFYRTVFAFDTIAEGKEENRRFAFLGRQGKALITLWEQSTGEFPVALPGLHHLSFQVDTIDEVKAAEQVLRELDAHFAHDGVVPHGEHGTSGGIFFTDPDGIRLEIYAPTGADPADAPTENAPTCGFF
ncbi:VOC family protein [Streptomyces sp. VRA16 Mangrove soil]|uniref:VOC family protein n=1 Tax=Streptomyces sp. VRA16 Mangrove soil TaxID=2817434 RepID=UPI001A9EE77A|nr:VOC family protein [Streptomyces sp. VRA16 Mangrove soil]MBO1331383.1 VOC family protein [Streptomyces sp. VRA16 Mangrove soil]